MKFCLLFLPILMLSCNNQDTTDRRMAKVILDTDMGSDCDDVGALAMLNEYANHGKVEILAVIYSSGSIPYGAGIIDAINRYYGNGDIPIGANHDSTFGDTVDKMLAEKLAKDTAAFGNTIIRNSDAVEQTQLLRNILSGQDDHSVIYITIGHTKALYDLLVSKADSASNLTGAELVQIKIKKWVALGALNANNSEAYYTRDWNFFFNGTAPYTEYLINHFQQPIYFVNGGKNVLTGRSLINTPSGNIIRVAYRDWLWNVEKKTLNDQRPSWDLVAVYFAVEKPESHFEILDQGYLDFDMEKGCRWIVSDSTTQHHYVNQRPGFEAELSDYLNVMISRTADNL